MKSRLYFLAFLGCLAFSCSDDPDPACSGDNALAMPWLTDLIEVEEQHEIGQSYSYLMTGMYKSAAMSVPQPIFFFMNCCPACLMAPPVIYDCGGNELGRMVSEGILWEEIQDKEVIWRSSNNCCNLEKI